MAGARAFATLTRLEGTPCLQPQPPEWCGKILVVGGRFSRSTELYDPVTEKWSRSGDRQVASEGHTATLLPDARVLVIGNDNAIAQIYDPNAIAQVVVDGAETEVRGAWYRAGNLTKRADHTATLLAGAQCGGHCGRVLVVGGGGPGPLQRAEMYDPQAQPATPGDVGAWAPVAPPTFGRSRHTATLLPSGQVLIAGGASAAPPELYDMQTGVWTTTAPGGFRERAAAILLGDGTALITGGRNNKPNTAPGALPEDAAEIYQPAREGLPASWTPTAPMASPRMRHTATLLADGRVLVAGGEGGDFNGGYPTRSAEIYDPTAPDSTNGLGQRVKGKWSTTGSMVEQRRDHAAEVLSDGRVLVAGGTGAQDEQVPYFEPITAVASAEVFDLTVSVLTGRPSVTDLQPTSGPERGGTEVVIRGAGFHDVTAVRFGDTAAAYFRVESSSRIVATSPARTPGRVLVSVVTSGGGLSLARERIGFDYYQASGVWTATGGMNVERTLHTATLLSGPGCLANCGKVLVVGGRDAAASSLDSAELYDPVTSSWSPAASLATPRVYHTATLLPNGKVLVIGGTSDGTTVLDSAELYDPAADLWTPTAPATDADRPLRARAAHSTVALGDGRVMVVGGCRDFAEGPGAEFRGHQCTNNPLKQGAVTVPAIYTPGEEAWMATSPPPAPEEGGVADAVRVPGQVATLLAHGPGTDDDEVLVTGGVDENYLPFSFTYTPSKEETDRPPWTVTPRPSERRVLHSAIPIAGGALIVGGVNPDYSTGFRHQPTAFVERYTRAGIWSTPGSLSTRRALGSATSLGSQSDGSDSDDVLVAGGCSTYSGTGPCDTYAGSAEIYHPGTGKSSITDSLLTARAGHAGTLLPGGRVLVSGGQFHEDVLASAEVFDPGAFRAPTAVLGADPPAGTTGGGMTVTVRGVSFEGGRVSVKFGSVPVRFTVRSDRELVAVTPEHAVGTVELTVTTDHGTASTPFTFAPGSWGASRPLDGCTDPSCIGRYGHAATLMADGRVLVTGGYQSDCSSSLLEPCDADVLPLASAQIYDPTTQRWRATGSMELARAGHTAVLLTDGNVLVVGGGEEPTTELYEPATVDSTTGQLGAWRSAGPLATNRRHHTASLLRDGRLLVAGGEEIDNQSSRTLRPRAGAAFPDPVRRLRSTEIFDPAAGLAAPKWKAGADLAQGRAGHSAILLRDGSVLVAGGCASLNGCSTERYGLGAWSQGAGPQVPRTGATTTLLSSGRVLLAGGCTLFETVSNYQRCGAYSNRAELYDPTSKTWEFTGSLHVGRAGHSATSLDDGKVLVTGSGTFRVEPQRSSEIYDPATGRWSYTSFMDVGRDGHTATALVGGHVLITGGIAAGGKRTNIQDSTGRTGQVTWPPAVASAELYTPAPVVTAVSPASGPTSGGTRVEITGSDLSGATAVSFGGAPADFIVQSPTLIEAAGPAHAPGAVDVVVTTPGGVSLSASPAAYRFTYLGTGVPGAVGDLAARAQSDTEILLSFTTAGTDGAFGQPATRYVVKESSTPITNDADFEAAPALCDGVCSFPAASLGHPISLTVRGRTPGTTYHYAMRALGQADVPGPISNPAWATTTGTPPAPFAQGTSGPCPDLPVPGPARVAYPPGYSMVGLPEGTRVGAQSPLYGWFDLGARGSYSARPGSEPVAGGRAYWAWFSCPRLVELSGPGAPAASLPLGGYRASMVGNPSGTGPVQVSGHDFAARWDPTRNGGSGGYHVSDYRQTQTLPVGEGTWVFSYRDTTVEVRR